jgi:uncharacterized protein
VAIEGGGGELQDKPASPQGDGLCHILSLDGGGANGFYTLGVLKEIEGMIGCRLYERFDIVFGTSTGAIIASLIALGYSVDEIHDLYKKHVPSIMKAKSASHKTAALEKLAKEVFKEKTFADVKTGTGVVATNWMTERPMIFKGSIGQAHGRKGTFKPGFGVPIADAVVASCSAYPFYARPSNSEWNALAPLGSSLRRSRPPRAARKAPRANGSRQP